MKKIFTNKYLPYIVITVLVFVLLKQCSDLVETSDRSAKNIEILEKDVEKSLTELKQERTSKEALQVTLEEVQAQLYIKDDSLKDILKKYRDVKSTTTIVTRWRIDTVEVPFLVPVPHEFHRNWNKTTPWYEIGGTVDQIGVGIDSIKMYNKQRLVIGVEGTFFKNKITASITNSNPHVETTGLETQTIIQRKKRWGVGAFVGMDYRARFTAGLGVNYDFWQF